MVIVHVAPTAIVPLQFELVTRKVGCVRTGERNFFIRQPALGEIGERHNSRLAFDADYADLPKFEWRRA